MLKSIIYIVLILIPCTVNADNNSVKNNNVIAYDFENDAKRPFKGWSYLLNSQGIKILPRPQNPENNAAFIEIRGSKDYLWNDRQDLNRVELQQKPKSTLSGENTTVSWQFMLPQLFSNEIHQIAYWESNKSYRQSLRLQLQKSRLSLVSSFTGKELWFTENIKPKQWYWLTLTVNWSVEQGNIRLSIDGKNVTNVTAKTLISLDESMFFQLGILRQKTDLIEQIWLDNFKMFNH